MEILSSPASMVPLNAKFGFHYPFFATLAGQKDVENPALDQSQLIRIDMTKALALISEFDGTLEITVPTLSFTDPSFEYDIRPSFATPFALNGLMASDSDVPSSRATEVWATDLMGNRYQLKFDQKGVIDFAQTLEALDEGSNVFTTLQSVTYVYDKSLLLNEASQFESVPQFDGQLVLLAPQHIPKKFIIDLSVKSLAGEVLHHHNIAYTPTALDTVLDVAELKLDWQGTEANGVLSIDVAAKANAMQNAFRYDFKLELPEIDHGFIRLHGSNDVIAESGQSAVLHQYHGLSTQALSDIFESMLPIGGQQGKGFYHQLSNDQTKGSGFNQFGQVEGAVESLYSHVIQGLTDSAIPLAAIRDYISPEFVDDILNFNTSHWDQHDNAVFSMMMDELSNFEADTASELSEQFVDIVDRYMALESKYPHASLILETSDIVIDEDFTVFAQITPQHDQYHLPITVGQGTVADYQFETLNDITNQANPFANNDDWIGDLNIHVEDFDHIKSQSSTFKVSEASILHEADIIEGFSFENQDRLDLTQLLNNLQIDDTSAQVHVKTNEQGDAMVYLSLDDDTAPQDIHVATLVGVNAAGGELPQDLSNFIDLI